MHTHFENESFVEDWIQGFTVDFSFKLLLFVREKIDFDVRIGRASHVQSRKLLRLNDGYR